MNDVHAAERDEASSARWDATERDYTRATLANRQIYHDLHRGGYIPDVQAAIVRLAAQKDNQEEL